MPVNAKIIADSVSASGNRLTTNVTPDFYCQGRKKRVKIHKSDPACSNTGVVAKPSVREWFRMDIVCEEWRPVVGYEEFFSISSHGRLRTEKTRSNCPKGFLRTPGKTNSGYLYHSLSGEPGSKRYNFLVHRLVAEAFIGKRPKGYTIDHIDGNKVNNHYQNLEYVTHKENIRRSQVLGLKKVARGQGCGSAKLTDADVLKIRSLEGKLTQKEIAQKFGVSRRTVGMVFARRVWAHVK